MKEFRLDKHKADEPFKIPEQYFDKLTENIQQKIDFREGKEAQYSKELPFQVPGGYFETLLQRIQARIGVKKVFSTVRLWKYGMAVASIFILLLIGYKWFSQKNIDKEELITESIELDISREDLLEYLTHHTNSLDIIEEVNISDKDLSEILDSSIAENNPTEVQPIPDINKEDVLHHIKKSELEELLLEEIDPEDLENLL